MGDNEPHNPPNIKVKTNKRFKSFSQRPPGIDFSPIIVLEPTNIKEENDDLNVVELSCSFECPYGTKAIYNLDADTLRNYYLEAMNEQEKKNKNNRKNSKDNMSNNNTIIGKGSYATVIQYEAKSSNDTDIEGSSDQNSNKTLIVAIKAIKIANREHKNYQYMVREGEVIKKLTQHQCNHTVKYYSSMKYEGLFWIIMEKMDVDLEKFIVTAHDLPAKENQPKIPLCFLKKLTFCLIEGLSYLHKEMKIIHRDIKPNNVLLKQSQNLIKICDFGVAGELTESNHAKSAGTGNEKWMSPERLGGKSTSEVINNSVKFKYCEKSDIWSAGLTILNVIVGDYPYGGRTAPKPVIMKKIITQIPEVPNAEVYSVLSVSATKDNIATSPHDSLERTENKHHIKYSRPNNTTNPLMNFLEKCLIYLSDPEAVESTNTSKFIELACDMKYRADYTQLKRDKFYKDIVKNEWNKTELNLFFESVFSRGF